jgi:hypothetical protein
MKQENFLAFRENVYWYEFTKTRSRASWREISSSISGSYLNRWKIENRIYHK